MRRAMRLQKTARQNSTVIRSANGAMKSNRRVSLTSGLNSTAEFREVFRNCYVTGFSIGAFVWSVCNLIFGLIFSAILLLFVGVVTLQTLYVTFGLDLYPPLDIKSTLTDAHPSIGEIVGGVIIFIIGFLVLATF